MHAMLLAFGHAAANTRSERLVIGFSKRFHEIAAFLEDCISVANAVLQSNDVHEVQSTA